MLYLNRQICYFRFTIQLSVGDATDSAIFTVFDSEASKFLMINAVDLDQLYSSRVKIVPCLFESPKYWWYKHQCCFDLYFFMLQADVAELYPKEIDTFKEMRFLFKVQVKVRVFNNQEHMNIQVSKLCWDEILLKEFIEKFKLEEVSFFDLNYWIDSNFIFSKKINYICIHRDQVKILFPRYLLRIFKVTLLKYQQIMQLEQFR